MEDSLNGWVCIGGVFKKLTGSSHTDRACRKILPPPDQSDRKVQGPLSGDLTRDQSTMTGSGAKTRVRQVTGRGKETVRKHNRWTKMGRSLCSQSPENQDQQVGGKTSLEYEKQFFIALVRAFTKSKLSVLLYQMNPIYFYSILHQT